MNVSQKITDIISYYKENPGCDPNMFEYVGLCYDMVQYLNKEAPNYGIYSTNERTYEEARKLYAIPIAVYDKFKILSQQFSEKLLGNDLGITKDSPIYRLFSDVTMGVGTYSAYGDTPLKQKLSGISLFIAQKKRDVAKGLIEDFIYNNTVEINEIQSLDKKSYDSQSGGHYLNDVYVNSKPSPRQLLLEEIMNEYQKNLKTR
jgi:hypothetical protein